eukprot:TRINITY_DN19974_c0_g1_i2.p2 TRINITY_DN19974_c0_g1~~TRINITY_DN19974_c0_g1_i2.p2  ORF type:complete len:214 (-),score=59.42 TRINITY_DN19974_c0_g1_i2:77-718(-)
MLTDADLVAPSTARFLTGFSALLVLTKSSSFCDLLFTFSGSAAVAAPTVGLLLVVMALYALAGRDIFSDKVLTAYGDQAYFSSYGRALSTMFQIFVGDGWAAAMYAASDRTTEAARIFFVSFVAVIGLLVTELIVGVIVTIFSDVNAMQSTHVYGLLAKKGRSVDQTKTVSYTHLRAHETPEHLVCRLLLEKKKKTTKKSVSSIYRMRQNINI